MMGELLFKLCGVAILSAMLIIVIKKWGADQALIIRAVIAVIIGGVVVGMLSPVVEYILSLSEFVDPALSSVVGVMLKTVCVAIICHICATVCRDLGETSIASYIELGGKIEMLILSLPLFEDVVNTVKNILEKI